MAAVFQALNLNPWTFLFQVINLLVVMGLLYVIMYKPITKMVEEREHRIESQLADAAEAKKNAEELLSRYETQVKGAKQEAQEILARATKLGEEMREEIVTGARQEAERTVTRAKAEIEGEKAKALSAIREEVATLAVLAAGKVIGRSLTSEDHERLAKEFVQEVGDLQ
ncbi:ATP synthase subunit B [Clostridiales bacterium PH28_bin88]|nr:ATP synthase subunit B [Clostridiales bacterium PH28_bin88]